MSLPGENHPLQRGGGGGGGGGDNGCCDNGVGQRAQELLDKVPPCTPGEKTCIEKAVNCSVIIGDFSDASIRYHRLSEFGQG